MQKKTVCVNDSSRVSLRMTPLAVATFIALGLTLPVQAAVVADTTAANMPGVHTAANGATIVDINKASAQGVSHNVYTSFDVDGHGVILNNSGANATTQLAGNISGNANMSGGSASIILNEVNSANPSQLNGMVEVAGNSAQVIIANPAGITCDGCGFVNASRSVLTTGTPEFDKDGNLQSLKVTQGQVTIEGKGMDVGNSAKPQYADIIARSVKVNGQIQANSLKIITGANSVEKNGRVTAITGTGPTPQLALDVSSLGSMYANRISMMGTEAGVGVRLDNADIAASNTLDIDVNGNLQTSGILSGTSVSVESKSGSVINTGTITADSGLSVSGKQVINQNGVIGGKYIGVNVSATDLIDNQHGQIIGDMTTLSADTVNNGKGYIQGKTIVSISGSTLDNRNGEINSRGDLRIDPMLTGGGQGVLNQNGVISSAGKMTIEAVALNNEAGLIESNGLASIDSDTIVNTNSANFVANNDWHNAYSHTGGIYTGGSQNAWENGNGSVIRAENIDNTNGTIASETAGVMLRIHGYTGNELNNVAGSISSVGSLELENYQQVHNDSGMISAGQNVTVDVQNYQGKQGTIHADNNVTLSAGQTWTNDGNVTAENALLMSSSFGKVINNGTMRGDTVDLATNDVTNNGSIAAKNEVYISGEKLVNSENATITGSSVMISSRNVTNNGVITPDPVNPDNPTHDIPSNNPNYPDNEVIYPIDNHDIPSNNPDYPYNNVVYPENNQDTPSNNPYYTDYYPSHNHNTPSNNPYNSYADVSYTVNPYMSRY